MLLRVAYASVLSWSIISSPASPQTPDSIRPGTPAYSCLPASEFQLRGIMLGSDGPTAVATLGKALRVRTRSGQDDGGRYELQTFAYRDLQIDIVRGLVDRIVTTSPSTATPSGLQPGLALDAVRRILLSKGLDLSNAADLQQNADRIVIPDCESPDGIVLGGTIALFFDRGHRVRRIEIAAQRP